MDLEALGWTRFFAQHFEQLAGAEMSAGRVVARQRGVCRVHTARGEVLASVAGKVRYRADGAGDFPAVGDWVGLSLRPDEKKGYIRVILPRKSKFARKVAGARTQEQVVAANVDTVFVMAGLDNDFNLRRIERYLTLAWESGARPVIVLNKTDLCQDIDDKIARVERVAIGVAVVALSALNNLGTQALTPYLRPGDTVVLLGSSGVGKTTLINRLLGREALRTAAVRARDQRGRHTTTQRELMILPQGGLIIDTPGLRELQLWEASEGLQDTFEEIESMARRCHFRDCRHLDEPRCAVKQALSDGVLAAERLENYRKLRCELDHLALRKDQHAQLEQKKKIKSIHKQARHHKPRE